MRRLFAAFACALGALAVVGPATAGVSVGVNDDAGKYANGDPQFWQTMKQNGLKQNAVTVLWDETQPLTILDQPFLQKSLPAAQAAGIKVVFDVYPMHSQAFTKNGASPAQFGAFLKKLAQTFPQVTEYVVMNECNQTRFINPQFDSSGQNQSAAICGAALAEGYDALKSVNAGIKVWGVGLSPRGNDNANATSNASTSPVNFLKALGAWYRQSGRSQPLMDGFDFHPYPIPQSLPFATGYADKENAAVSNLPRIYQAFYDGFKGTSQKTIGPGGLPVSLNEVGIQTDNTGKAGYTGNEVSGDANGGVRGDTATESFQASWYKQMLDYVACDPNIQVVNLFHLVDEAALEGWQSGLYYVGYQAKQSASTVSQWIAQTGGNCAGAQKTWTPDGGAAGGSPGGATADPLAQFLQLFQSPALDNVSGAASSGNFGLFGLPSFAPLFQAMLGASNAFTAAFSQIAAQAGPLVLQLQSFIDMLQQSSSAPNVTGPAQALANLSAVLAGGLKQAATVDASLSSCTGSCSLQDFLSSSTRTTASAAKKRPKAVKVAFATAKVRAKAVPKLKVKAVKGAKHPYGAYVFVYRVTSKAKPSKSAAFAVKFTIAKKAKAATKAKAKAKHGKAKPAKSTVKKAKKKA